MVPFYEERSLLVLERYEGPEPLGLPSLMVRVWRDSRNRCVYCGEWFAEGDERRTIDHLRPKALGGKDRRENLVAACWACNQAKAEKWPVMGLVHPEFVGFVRERLCVMGWTPPSD